MSLIPAFVRAIEEKGTATSFGLIASARLYLHQRLGVGVWVGGGEEEGSGPERRIHECTNSLRILGIIWIGFPPFSFTVYNTRNWKRLREF